VAEEEPRRVKHYELIDRLGEGGMGVVYRAHDTRLGRTVALKLLPREMADNEERRQRFEREARIVSGMSHPGIATLYDFDHEGDEAFLVMEFVNGSNLRVVLGDGPLPLDGLLDCAVQVADALSAAHRGGIVHRDLKPENIMAAESGHYKVLDFGVARAQPVATGEGPIATNDPTRTWATRAGALVGTVAYMSPEQVMSRPVDARSDLFSFGSLLYELGTGRPAFRGDNEIASAHAIAYEEPPPLRELRPDAPRGLERIVARCLAKLPEARYASAEELRQDLRTLQMDSLTGSRRGRLLADDPRGPGKRRRVWIAAAATLAVVAVVALAAVALRGSRTSAPETVGAPTRIRPAAPALPVVGERGGPPRVIVAFFENNTGAADADWVSRGLPEMLTTDLSGADSLDVIATQRLYDLLAMSGEEARTLDRSSTAELARWAGADVVISGSVFRSGEQFRIDAQAYDTSTGSVLTAHKVEGAELFGLVSELTAGLLAGLEVETPTTAPAQVMAVVPESAYRGFLEGKQLYDNLRFAEAEEAIRTSLAEAPDFSVARLQLAKSLLSRGEAEAARPELERALAGQDELGEADRILASALGAWYLDGDYEAGNERIEELVERFPSHEDAYVWWGRASGQLAGDTLRATRQLRRALERDPSGLAAIVELADQLARVGDSETAAAMLEEVARRHPQARAVIDERIEEYQRP
jgi:TolB-like protein